MSVAIGAACTACGACIVTCPERALAAAPRRPAVDATRCTDCLACVEVCPVDAIDPDQPGLHPPEVHPIEVESYRILASRVDLSAWAEPARAVVARMIHASADESWATSARVGTGAVDAAVEALGAGAPVVCDANMVVAGVPSLPQARCLLGQVGGVPPGSTRSAAAIALAARLYPAGAVWVIGNAPTALGAVIDLWEASLLDPAAVIGLPVGYVGAAAAKDRLWDSALRRLSITNAGDRGGSAVAAAALNALARLAAGRDSPRDPP
ncbi:MAG: precorrin-8X methylmutase, partial [Acidimicrobiales bacterium]